MPIEEDTPILDVLLYMLVRYHTSNKKLQKRLYQKIIIQLFNYVYIHQPVGFWEEPMPFNVKNETCVYLLELMAIYQLGIEQERILHILEELKAVVLTRIPLLQPNRLFLMVTATYVGKITGDDGWYSFAARLQRHIDWERILVQDIPDKNLFPMTGVIGVWGICQFYNSFCNVSPILLDSNLLKERIVRSTLWERLEGDEGYLKYYRSLNGLCGVQLFLQYLDCKLYEK